MEGSLNKCFPSSDRKGMISTKKTNFDANMHLFFHRDSRMHWSMWWMSGQGLNMSCSVKGASGGLLLAPTWTSFSWTWPRDPVEWGRRWFGTTCFTFIIPSCLILSPTQALRLVYFFLVTFQCKGGTCVLYISKFWLPEIEHKMY